MFQRDLVRDKILTQQNMYSFDLAIFIYDVIFANTTQTGRAKNILTYMQHVC